METVGKRPRNNGSKDLREPQTMCALGTAVAAKQVEMEVKERKTGNPTGPMD